MSDRKTKRKPKHTDARQTLALLRTGFYNTMRPERLLIEDLLHVAKYFDARLQQLERK